MAHINLRKAGPRKPLISLVPLVDVMLILLVFFMVTSTYLDLDMVPAVEQAEESGPLPSATDAPPPLLIRLNADGQPAVRGQVLSLADLGRAIEVRLQQAPSTPVLVLPSGAADMQALISLMDAATLAGATRLQVIRLEARP